MDTTLGQKAAALARALVTSPRDLPGWLAQLPAWGRSPADLELPWWSYGAIRAFAAFLQPAHRVFEYGSGGSSFFTARRAATVLAVENDPVWQGLVTGFARERGLANLACELHPLADDSLATFRASSFSQRILADTWDVVIIDCLCGFQASRYGVIRPAAFADALPRVNPGGLIVLDDSWMYPELLVPRPGWDIRDFVGTGPCRYGVTSTALLRRVS